MTTFWIDAGRGWSAISRLQFEAVESLRAKASFAGTLALPMVREAQFAFQVPDINLAEPCNCCDGRGRIVIGDAGGGCLIDEKCDECGGTGQTMPVTD